MAVFGSNRPHASLTDLRILLLKELERTDLSDEHRVRLLEKAADMQVLSARKWKIRRENAKVNKKNKAFTHRRKYDSEGNPLYNDVPVRKQVEDEPQDQKAAFLSGLRTKDEGADREPGGC